MYTLLSLIMLLPISYVGAAEENLDSFLTEGLRGFFEATLKPSRHTPPQVFSVTQRQLKIQLYRPKSAPSISRRACEAFEYLFYGGVATKEGTGGAKEAFFRFPELKSIELSFYEINRVHQQSRRTNGMVDYRTTTRSAPYLKLIISREKAAVQAVPARSALQSASRCLPIGEKWVTRVQEISR